MGRSSKNKPSKDQWESEKDNKNYDVHKGKMETVQPLYEYLNILPLNLNRKLLCAKFMYNLVYKKHPIVIENKFLLHYNKSINNSTRKN